MSRRSNSKNLDPMRFAPEAKSLSNLPGSPENTNPMNMRTAGQESTPPIGGSSIYNDSNQNGVYPQMGSQQYLIQCSTRQLRCITCQQGQKLNAGFKLWSTTHSHQQMLVILWKECVLAKMHK